MRRSSQTQCAARYLSLLTLWSRRLAMQRISSRYCAPFPLLRQLKEAIDRPTVQSGRQGRVESTVTRGSNFMANIPSEVLKRCCPRNSETAVAKEISISGMYSGCKTPIKPSPIFITSQGGLITLRSWPCQQQPSPCVKAPEQPRMRAASPAPFPSPPPSPSVSVPPA